MYKIDRGSGGVPKIVLGQTRGGRGSRKRGLAVTEPFLTS